MKLLVALITGLLFGLGLTTSQMVNPDKVLNFLDLFGNWDPSLAFVMGGALTVYGIGYFFLIKGRNIAICGDNIPFVVNSVITKRLVIGSAIFGLGWGLAGICPGPALTNIGSGEPKIFAFVAVMIIGMKASSLFTAKFLPKSSPCD
ncbi:MAG: YeeE/YedE family protein [Kangiellaceae bacterium]|jgi:uncharacterized membrane protein YedE/YeeE|nr:YeeE/YedE family protein [Kangiellaceae bacterium]